MALRPGGNPVAPPNGFATLAVTEEGLGHEELERAQDDRRARRHAGRASAQADIVVAAPRRTRCGRDCRHRHSHFDRGRGGEGRPGGDSVLRDRRPDLRLRGARLCRGCDDDPGVGLGLYLFLRGVRRADRVDDRRRAHPRVYARGQRRGGRLVRLCGGVPEVDRARPARCADPGSRTRRCPQRPRDLHHLGDCGPVDGRHSRKRNAQRPPGRDQDACAGDVHCGRAAGVRCVALPPVHALSDSARAARRGAKLA